VKQEMTDSMHSSVSALAYIQCIGDDRANNTTLKFEPQN